MWFEILSLVAPPMVFLCYRLRWIPAMEQTIVCTALLFFLAAFGPSSIFELLKILLFCGMSFLFSAIFAGLSENREHKKELFFGCLALTAQTLFFSLLFGGIAFGAKVLFA